MTSKTALIRSLLLSFTFSAVACDVETAPEPPAEDLTKDEVAQLSVAGKADGFDFCAYFDWYGDGICDPFCLFPDPDCEDAPQCPDVCGALCAGESEPEAPTGCPIPQCVCDDEPPEPICPDVCSAVCAGEPEPEIPNGCPTPLCDCGVDEEEPVCPDVCAAVCAGEPEPEIPFGCPIPLCAC